LARKGPSPRTAAILDQALARSGAKRCVMFGCPAYSLGGNLFAGVFGEAVFLQLSDQGRAEVVSEGGRPFEPLEGRRLRRYVLLPSSVVDDGEALSAWLRRAIDFVKSLPKRPRKRSRASRSREQ